LYETLELAIKGARKTSRQTPCWLKIKRWPSQWTTFADKTD